MFYLKFLRRNEEEMTYFCYFFLLLNELQCCYEGQSNPNEKGKGESGRNCNDIKEKESPTGE